MARSSRGSSRAGSIFKPSVLLYRNSLRKGLLGGDRLWRVVFGLIVVRRALRKVMGGEVRTVAVEQVKVGETLILRGVRSRKTPVP